MTAGSSFSTSNKQDLFPTIRPPNPFCYSFIYRNPVCGRLRNLLGRHPEWSRRIRYFKKMYCCHLPSLCGQRCTLLGINRTMIAADRRDGELWPLLFQPADKGSSARSPSTKIGPTGLFMPSRPDVSGKIWFSADYTIGIMIPRTKKHSSASRKRG